MFCFVCTYIYINIFQVYRSKSLPFPWSAFISTYIHVHIYVYIPVAIGSVQIRQKYTYGDRKWMALYIIKIPIYTSFKYWHRWYLVGSAGFNSISLKVDRLRLWPPFSSIFFLFDLFFDRGFQSVTLLFAPDLCLSSFLRPHTAL